MIIKHPLNATSQKEQFTVFIKVLATQFKPLYIYCFGKSMECSSREGCFIDTTTEGNCRYYLLMVIEGESRIEHHVQNYADDHFKHGNITILVHGKDAVNEAVQANNKFFISVTNNGELLYSKDSIIKSFRVSGYIPTRAAAKADSHYRYRMVRATGFLESALQCQRSDNYDLSLFMLHQVVEQCCISLIRVYLAYQSDFHNLYRLLHLCDSFSPALSRLLLQESEEDKRLFDLLARSYSAARYNDGFHVDKADAEKLYDHVAAFLKLTEVMCTEKIESLAKDAESYKQLQKESEILLENIQ